MEKNRGGRWLDLFHQREKLEGTRVIGMVRHLGVSHYTLNRNYEELFKAVTYYENDWHIWAVENRQKLDNFLKEFLRLLHNYLASIFSLIEHTRVFCNHLCNSQFEKSYQVELEKLKINDCILFLKDLRTYTQHYKMLNVVASVSFKREEAGPGKAVSKQRLQLNKDDLLKWEGWLSVSKKYLSKYEKEIDLKTVISDYQGLINKFYDWLYKEVIKLYSKEIEELSKIEGEIIKLQEEMDNKSVSGQ